MSPPNSEMTDAEFVERLNRFVDKSGTPRMAKDVVNEAMIRHWCVALGDRNPLYSDSESASAHSGGNIIAPPAMLQAWTMPDVGEASSADDPVDELYAFLDARGYSSIVATNSEQDYLEPLRLGDRVRSVKTIKAISGPKRTALGEGHFITSEIVFSRQDGAVVGRQLHRVLKFRPTADQDEFPAARRSRPNVTQDTAFFFEGAARGRLLIQQCRSCGTLQHPPTAACANCTSLDLDHTEMSGKATLYSYAIVHKPVVEPFKPPYAVILAELAEGPRLVSGLLGADLEAIRIGMPLEVDFLKIDAKTALPVFRAAGE